MPLQFQNPTLLWGLFSLIIPIIIHLFNFKRFKPIYFSNLKYLKDITAENKNKSKIKNWLLLLTRLLALTCLIIAFAQPYIPIKNSLINNKQNTTAYIYIDNSFSMNAETGKGIAIEVAKAKAIKLVNSFSDDTQIKILDNARGKKRTFLNKEAAISKIQEIQTTSGSKLFSKLIQEMTQIESLAHNKFYILSDFQKYQANFKEMPNDSNLNINLLPLPIQSKNNLYIDSCWFNNLSHKINKTEALTIKIHNSSNQNFRKISIKLYINDSLKTLSNFDIEAQNSTEINLPFKNHKYGIYSGRIEINDYPITYDNTLFFSFEIQQSLQLICVNQKNENTYINQLFADKQYFDLKNLNKSDFNQEELSKTRLIILNQLTNLQSGFRQKISHYINKGGRVLIIPNKENNDSNNELLNKLGASQFMQIDSLTKRVDNIELNAEIYKKAFDKFKKDARLPLIFRHFKLSESKKQINIPLWKSKSGENLFSQTNIGKGKLYTSTFKFDPKWTNAIKHPLFVPSLINIALNNTSHYPLYYNLNSDKYILANGLRKNSEKAVFHIENIALGIDLIPEQITHFDKGLLLNTNGQIKKAGNYFISQTQQIISGISFNYDRQESNLNFYSSKEIHNLLETYNLNYKVFDLNTTNIKTMVIEQKEDKSFWKLFLLLTFAFLLIELIVQKMKLF